MTKMEEFLKERGFSEEDFVPWPKNGIMKHIELRDEIICKFGFAILTSKTVEVLRSYVPILEVGAGSGYWAYELRRVGVDVVATDPGTGKYRFDKCDINGGKWKFWTSVEKINALDAIAKYPRRSLLIVWPDYDETWAATALKAYEGNTVLYVGEGTGGCTGNDEFHNVLDKGFPIQKVIEIPQHFGIHDNLFICRKEKIAC